MDQNRIYLDNAATTQTAPEVVEAMRPYFLETYAVASSQFSHTPGIMAKEGLDKARQTIADSVQASPEEIVLTSGGTEANNLAVKGGAWAQKDQKNQIICSRIEHNSVLDSAKWLTRQGFELVLLDVDNEGFTDLNQLQDRITDKTALVSIQLANQEVGTLQDVQTAAEIVKKTGALFHVDAQFGFTYVPIDLKSLPADLMTLSSHRIHGPNGVGALFVRKDTPLEKMMHGGYHENNLRSGTENVAGAVGFAKAVELAQSKDVASVKLMQQALFESLQNNVEIVTINGPKDLSRRVPNNVNVSFDKVEGESVVLHLDMRGVAVITGSACFSRSLEPSYVMMAMGYSHERAHGSIRFTLSRYNTPDEMERTAVACKEIVENLRRISPLA